MIEKYNITKILKKGFNIYAHKNNQKLESLEKHSKLTFDYAINIIKDKKLEPSIKKMITKILKFNNNYNEQNLNFLYEMFLLAIYYHDLGKINPTYQLKKMNNKITDKIPVNGNHSIYSMYIYNNLVFECYKKHIAETNQSLNVSIVSLLFLFGLIISKHHSNLSDFDNIDIFRQFQKDFLDDIDNITLVLEFLDDNIKEAIIKNIKIYSQIKINNLNEEVYFLLKLLNSLIISSDYYATYEFMENNKLDIKSHFDIDKIYNIYKESKIYKSIQNYKCNKVLDNNMEINKLRCEMFLEANKNIEKESNFYYLEAPTGGGKTNISINLALKLIENNNSLNKVFYVFPFNTLVEQTKNFLYKEAFNSKIEIGEITSVAKPKYTDEENYQKTWNINNLMYNYDIVLTSHVHFFNTILELGKESQYAFIHLANSVVILDEIQSYKNILWDKIIVILNYISKIFNIKFIIMSATLPNLNELLIYENHNIVNLINDSNKYYQDEIFKKRVQLDFSLLKKENFTLVELEEEVLNIINNYNYKKVLIEFINKSMARKFYNKIKEIKNVIVLELTGSDSAYFKNKIIELVKTTTKKIILVSTQVIEAGVDIDFDVGFKHYSLLDSEEQFLGRINRSNTKLNSKAYFFKIEGIGIYRNDYRKNYTILEQEYQNILVNKNYGKYYDNVIDNLKIRSKLTNEKGIDSFYSLLSQLKYRRVRDEMKLIDSYKGYKIFVNFDYKINEGMVINGKEVFEKMKNIYYSELDYNKKKYKLALLYEKMSIFMFDIVIFENNKLVLNPNYYDEEFGDIYYFNNLNHAINIDNGIVKLDYDAFLNDCFI